MQCLSYTVRGRHSANCHDCSTQQIVARILLHTPPTPRQFLLVFSLVRWVHRGVDTSTSSCYRLCRSCGSSGCSSSAQCRSASWRDSRDTATALRRHAINVLCGLRARSAGRWVGCLCGYHPVGRCGVTGSTWSCSPVCLVLGGGPIVLRPENASTGSWARRGCRSCCCWRTICHQQLARSQRTCAASLA